MTLDEKIGQMTQPDQDVLKDLADVENLRRRLRPLRAATPTRRPTPSRTGATCTSASRPGPLKSRLKIPILYGVDAVHGHSNVVGAVVFPHNVGLGATRDAALVEEISRVTALEIRATGINWAFAPCVAVPRDERWGRTYEGFSEDPKLVAELGAAAMRGLQGAASTTRCACSPARSTSRATGARPTARA